MGLATSVCASALNASSRWQWRAPGRHVSSCIQRDAVLFPEPLSEAAVKNLKLVAEKTDLSVEAVDLCAHVDVTDMVNAAPATPGDPTLDGSEDARTGGSIRGIQLSAGSTRDAGSGCSRPFKGTTRKRKARPETEGNCNDRGGSDRGGFGPAVPGAGARTGTCS
jgi:hypothetical protein